MGVFSKIVSAFTGSNSGGNSGGNASGTSASQPASLSGSTGTGTNRSNNNQMSLSSFIEKVKDPKSLPDTYYAFHNEQGRPHGTILSKEDFEKDPVLGRYYRGDYGTYVRTEKQKAATMQDAINRSGKPSRESTFRSSIIQDNRKRMADIIDNPATFSRLWDTPTYKTAQDSTAGTNKPNTEVPSFNPNYQASKEAVDAYMSGTYFGPTWEEAKKRNPNLTDEALLEYYGGKASSDYWTSNPGSIAGPSDADMIAALESQAKAAYALKRKQSPDYIAKDYNEYVDMVNQGLIAPQVRTDATGKQISIPYGTSKDDYNAYLQRKYADNGDDYYNRSYGELAKDDPKFWAGDSEAFDADGNPIDTNTYLWLLNNPLTRTVLQGMDASGNFSGAGPTMEQLARDPSTGGYGLYSEKGVADMYASHILAGDEMGAMLESNPELLDAILTQAYIPTVDPNNPVTYKPVMITNPDGTESRHPSGAMWGTLNLAEGSKTPAQLAAELLADPTDAEGMTNLQLLAAANALNNQDVPASEETGNKNKPSSSSGSGGSGGGSYGGDNMPAGGNPETTDTLYSMPEVGNYAARMILNKMLPTGYDYDYNKRFDKRLADIAAAEQNYRGNVLPSVERTYQDQAANTMANLVAALRANRASGLTSGASRGAQAASDVQAVQAASKENSENLRKLVNDNLASFLTQLASKRATAGNDTASELQGYASPMMTALGEVLAQYNYGSAAAQVNNGGLRRMQSYLV